jgi:rhodanese-related sulfurtransferase
MKNINCHELKSLKEKVKTRLIDVREPSEYVTGHIKDSINIPLSLLLNEIEEYENEEHVIMICRAGVRSLAACEKLISAGYNLNLYNLEGGIISWKSSGYLLDK